MNKLIDLAFLVGMAAMSVITSILFGFNGYVISVSVVCLVLSTLLWFIEYIAYSPHNQYYDHWYMFYVAVARVD